MRIGIGSYTFPWAVAASRSARHRPMDAFDVVEKAAAFGLNVVQIADNLPLHAMPASERSRLAGFAREKGVDVEVGMRGIAEDLVIRYLAIAGEFDSPIVRTVVDTADYAPDVSRTVAHIRAVMPAFEQAETTLAVENHDRFTTTDLCDILETVDHPNLGICLDTVNSFGALEGPAVVIDRLLPHAVNLHLKDFDIEREPNGLGFRIEGRPAGRGRLAIPELIAQCRSRVRSAIIELWTPFDRSVEDTIALELQWAEQSVRYMRSVLPPPSAAPPQGACNET